MNAINRNFGVSIAVVAVMAVAVGLLSYFAQWLGDDAAYAFSFADGKHVDNAGAIFPSMWAHYMGEGNGRYAVHWLVQWFCAIGGKLLFAICNVLVYVVFVALVARLARVTLDNWRGVLSIVAMTMLCLATRMTPSCQINYVWNLTLNMGFLLLWLDRDGGRQWWKLVVIFIYAAVCGNGNESISVGLGAALALTAVTRPRRLGLRRWVLTLGYVGGALFLCLSPATRHRAAATDWSALMATVRVLASARAMYVLVAVALWQLLVRRVGLRRLLDEGGRLLWLAWALCLAFNWVVGVAVGRAMAGEEILAVIIVLRLLRAHALTPFWLVVTVAAWMCMLGLQVRAVAIVNRQMADLQALYTRSADGRVRIVATDVDMLLPDGALYTHSVPYTGDVWQRAQLQRRVALDNPGHGPLHMLPAALAVDTVTTNSITPVSEGVWLLVQLKDKPAVFTVERTASIPLPEAPIDLGESRPTLQRHYAPVEISFDSTVIVEETSRWRARYATNAEYSIYGITDQILDIRY